MIDHTDLVITSLPWHDTDSPLLAPALLKSSLVQHGIRTVAFDLNQEVLAYCQRHDIVDLVKNFFLHEQTPPGQSHHLVALISMMADRVLEKNPRWVALSLLTYNAQTACRWLCFEIKRRSPQTKIVIGGAGVFVSLKAVDDFAGSLKRQSLIDHYISGDGELSLPALIQGRDYPGINETTWQQIQDLESLPLPDFDDYDFSLYKVKATPILGSRGCVRNCTFCDVHEHWEKFQWRSAESIFNEMRSQHQRYGFNLFMFGDSLINGNQKEYRRLIQLLADYNSTLEQKQRIRWTSFFIFRPSSAMSEEDWRLTAASGAAMLSVGIESFVDHIRYHMKKKFSNADIDHSLEMAKKYNIPLLFLVIVGYVTETEEDHQAALEWIKQHRQYAGMPVVKVRIGNTLSILPGTWLFKHREELNITLGPDDPHTGHPNFLDWTRADIGSTPDVRYRRHKEIATALEQNGFDVNFFQDAHEFLERYAKQHHPI